MPVTINNFGVTGFAFPVVPTSSGDCDYPAPGDVRLAVAYDDGGQVGTLVVPAEAAVRFGTQYGEDGTEYTGSLYVPTLPTTPSGRLYHSAADILSRLLIIKGVGANPAVGATWPIAVNVEPDRPDNAITVRGTVGVDDGRSMHDGTKSQHYGIQVRIRSTTQLVGIDKASEVVDCLTRDIYQEVVTIGEHSYYVHCVSRVSDPIELPKEPTSSRIIHTVNCLVTVKRYEAPEPLEPEPDEFTPTDIAGIGLWMKADAGTFQSAGGAAAVADTDPVGQWQDQSGNSRHLLQSTAGERPSLKLSIKNGLPVVRFDGVDNYMEAIYNRTQPQTVFIVSKVSSDGNRTIYDSVSVGNAGRLISNPGTQEHLSIYAGGIVLANTTAARGDWTISGAVFNGASSVLRVNGVEVSGNAGATQGNGFRLGSFGDVTPLTFLDGDIGEVIIYDAVLSLEQREQVETYLNDRWSVY